MPNGATRLGLYVRLAFGALVLFGIVGSLSGHRTGATFIFILTSLCWTLSRIVVEAFYAYRTLTSVPSPPKPPKSDPPPDPPTAVA